ncbi:2-oxoacid:acceptor oxidoreductase family protein [Anaerotignum propionicum]|uniref:2-oxoacid:acceptor oxidoreductase family protein n=1 Tax=Anaerotignum propionicum TaxID=28446 RepID=UPI002109D014|nr:2-oxoacid:acceptor oxidoreductase family protein [Anaerotignum propionicum]MCQ4937236.1 2-oxoacid:acceptor oxidoreductase family protein [Anaerotignum propionicum]
MMVNIRWHGRGGQGAFTAARLLGAAYSSHENQYALAFPSFGPERRGAPIQAFTKLDTKPVVNRSEVNQADYIIFLDDTLFTEGILRELKADGKVLLNTKQSFDNSRILTIDADSIAAETLKQPITNTIMLGAFAEVFQGIGIQDIQEAIQLHMPAKLHDRNILAVQQAAAEIHREVVL